MNGESEPAIISFKSSVVSEINKTLFSCCSFATSSLYHLEFQVHNNFEV